MTADPAPLPLGLVSMVDECTRMDARTQVISWLWAISPLITLGVATPVTFLWAAQRVRSRHFLVASVVYTVLVLLGFFLPDEDVASVFSTVAWLAGTAHALAFRGSSRTTV